MRNQGISHKRPVGKRLAATALVAMATMAMTASLTVGNPSATEDNPNYPVFPPREKLAFSE